ncbi:MAG: hypothetical protein R3B41_00640 [Candidatus Doudnabacteria bacterium]
MNKSQKQTIAVGASLAAIAAAAAGVYMLTGKNAKNRKKLAKWANDMQKDIVKELKQGSKATKAHYNKVVENVAKEYKKLKKVDTAEVIAMAAELKSHWDAISKEFKSTASKVSKAVSKSPAKKTTKKKVAKKVKKTVTKKRATTKK